MREGGPVRENLLARMGRIFFSWDTVTIGKHLRRPHSICNKITMKARGNYVRPSYFETHL
jgi:hypothetical protein